MTREKLKDLLPIMQAFVEGKLIQCKDALNDWYDINELYLGDDQLRKLKLEYRIKSEPKYRPFKTQEECWYEMLKHQPFGWVVRRETGNYATVVSVTNSNIMFQNDIVYSYNKMMDNYTFTDGEPFGVKEE